MMVEDFTFIIINADSIELKGVAVIGEFTRQDLYVVRTMWLY